MHVLSPRLLFIWNEYKNFFWSCVNTPLPSNHILTVVLAFIVRYYPKFLRLISDIMVWKSFIMRNVQSNWIINEVFYSKNRWDESSKAAYDKYDNVLPVEPYTLLWWKFKGCCTNVLSTELSVRSILGLYQSPNPISQIEKFFYPQYLKWQKSLILSQIICFF